MLCRRTEYEKPFTTQITDSLQANQIMFPPAQNSRDFGRVSLCSSFLQGSLTVEAALALPIFMIALLILISLLDMTRIYSEYTLSLNESAKTLGMYAYAVENSPDNAPLGALSTGVCVAYAKSKLPKEDRVNVSFVGSSYDDSFLLLKARVSYRFLYGFSGIKKASFVCSAGVHPWTGLQDKEKNERGTSQNAMVYITDYQSVYHTHGDCTHLDLSITVSSGKKVSALRNSYGQSYSACPLCHPKGNEDILFVTDKGDNYHSSSKCSALKRSGRMVRISDVGDLEKCERCKQRDDS